MFSHRLIVNVHLKLKRIVNIFYRSILHTLVCFSRMKPCMHADLNEDENTDVYDVVTVAMNFGKTY